MTLPGAFDQAIVAYTSDTGTVFTISQRRDNALLVGNQIVSERTNQGIPEFWNLRFIRLQTVHLGRTYQRKIVIGSPTNPLFTGMQRLLNIDGVTWIVTGCKGERMRGPTAQ